MQNAAPSLIMGTKETALLFPYEAVHRHDEALDGGQIFKVADLHRRILNMSGDDGKILTVERDKFQSIHAGSRRCEGFAIVHLLGGLWRRCNQSGAGKWVK